jgi:hypothetical protein
MPIFERISATDGSQLELWKPSPGVEAAVSLPTGVSLRTALEPLHNLYRRRGAMILPIGRGEDDDAYTVRVFGVRSIGAKMRPGHGLEPDAAVLALPILLYTLEVTLGTVVGLDGELVTDDDRFAKAITLTKSTAAERLETAFGAAFLDSSDDHAGGGQVVPMTEPNSGEVAGVILPELANHTALAFEVDDVGGQGGTDPDAVNLLIVNMT